MQKVIVTVPEQQDKRHRNWAKLVTRVDRSKANGYAFEGQFLSRGQLAEVPVGGIILAYDQVGSMQNWAPLVRVYRVEADGSLTQLLEWRGERETRGSWALAVRDQVADLLEAAQDQPAAPQVDLSQVPTEALLAELRRRGIQV